MGDIGEVAGAVKSVADLIDGILGRGDRDKPDNELNENQIKIQNSFANADLDEQYRIMYQLFTNVGYAPTPGGSVGDADRQFRHSALLIAAQLKYAKQIISRLVDKIAKED